MLSNSPCIPLPTLEGGGVLIGASLLKVVDLESPMPNAKIKYHRTSGSEEDLKVIFTMHGYGGHLGHVTWTICLNFHSPFLRRFHDKFGFDWPSGSEDL